MYSKLEARSHNEIEIQGVSSIGREEHYAINIPVVGRESSKENNIKNYGGS